MFEEGTQARIVVQHLSDEMDAKEIKEMFSKYGSIIDVDIATTNFGKPKGKVFIQFARRESAQAAIKGLHGKRFGDKVLVVSQFEESAFQRVRKNAIYEEQDDYIGREEGLEPPAYIKYPRRTPFSNTPNTVHIPRPKTPPLPTPKNPPRPPPLELYHPPEPQIIPPPDPNSAQKSREDTREDTPRSSRHRSSDDRHERHNHKRDRDERKRYEDKSYYEEREKRKHRDDKDREDRHHRDRHRDDKERSRSHDKSRSSRDEKSDRKDREHRHRS